MFNEINSSGRIANFNFIDLTKNEENEEKRGILPPNFLEGNVSNNEHARNLSLVSMSNPENEVEQSRVKKRKMPGDQTDETSKKQKCYLISSKNIEIVFNLNDDDRVKNNNYLTDLVQNLAANYIINHGFSSKIKVTRKIINDYNARSNKVSVGVTYLTDFMRKNSCWTKIEEIVEATKNELKMTHSQIDVQPRQTENINARRNAIDITRLQSSVRQQAPKENIVPKTNANNGKKIGPTLKPWIAQIHEGNEVRTIRQWSQEEKELVIQLTAKDVLQKKLSNNLRNASPFAILEEIIPNLKVSIPGVTFMELYRMAKSNQRFWYQVKQAVKKMESELSL